MKTTFRGKRKRQKRPTSWPFFSLLPLFLLHFSFFSTFLASYPFLLSFLHHCSLFPPRLLPFVTLSSINSFYPLILSFTHSSLLFPSLLISLLISSPFMFSSSYFCFPSVLLFSRNLPSFTPCFLSSFRSISSEIHPLFPSLVVLHLLLLVASFLWLWFLRDWVSSLWQRGADLCT